jgi:hypothetical protein
MSNSREAPTTEATGTERRFVARSIAALLWVVLAALLTGPAAVAYWGQRMDWVTDG